MIQTNHSAAVSWPVAGSSSAAAVPPVLAVAPAAAASGDNRAGMEQAPDQPRQAAPTEPDAKPAPTAAERQAEAAEAQARREARAEAQRETVERLRDTLRKVWDASGAVVEQALAREAQRTAGSLPSPLTGAGRALPAYEEAAEPSAAPGSRVNRRV